MMRYSSSSPGWMRVSLIILIDFAFCLELLSSFRTWGFYSNLKVKGYRSMNSRLNSVGGLFPLLTSQLPPSGQAVNENDIAILEQFVASLSLSLSLTSKNDQHNYNWNHKQEDIDILSWAVSILSSKNQQPVLHVSMHNNIL